MYYSLQVHDKSKCGAYFNFLIWTLRDSRLGCWGAYNEGLTYAIIQNMLADVEEWKYAFYWIHVNMDSNLSTGAQGIARNLLKRIHGEDADNVIKKYNKLLNLAYPKK